MKIENGQATILVAVFNKKDTIKSCIDSLLNQSYAPDKIMILDGGSSDGTYEILKNYKDKINLLQIKTGLSSRLNWALDNINTDYVAITDADCVVSENWLEELLKGFSEDGVIASAGYCGTPENVSFFQKLIGMELESRFKKFPKYISRAPTMSLCLKTGIARSVKFDEKQKVDIETDFGYRLTKLGKMVYLPKAQVFHYHRADFKGYFIQQKEYAKWGLRLLSIHKKKAVGDHITTLSMLVQIPIFFMVGFFLICSLLNPIFLYISLIFIFVLFVIYIKNLLEINSPINYYPGFIALFLLRNFAWLFGIFEGFIFFPATFFYKQKS